MMKKNKEKQERDACSFKPQTTTYKKQNLTSVSRAENQADQPNGKPEGAVTERVLKKHTKLSTVESTADRCKLLYELSKKITKKDDKPSDVYKLEKEREQYTFAPNTKKDGVNVKPSDAYTAATMDKAIERMKKARAERERVKNALSRGGDDTGMRFNIQKDKFAGSFQQFSNSKEISLRRSKDSSKKMGGTFENPASMQAPFSMEISPQATKGMEEDASQRASASLPKQMEGPQAEEYKGSMQALSEAQSIDHSQAPTSQPDNKEALLFIDVNLGNKQKRIVVYKGDKASELAESFATENGLDDVAKEKLEILINLQIKQVLDKIEEEGQSDEEGAGGSEDRKSK